MSTGWNSLTPTVAAPYERRKCGKLQYRRQSQTAATANMIAFAIVACCFLSSLGWGATRTFEFETSEVTQPGLSVAPDGRSLVFNLVGHLFRLPLTGGTATQLTFGPYYDSDP